MNHEVAYRLYRIYHSETKEIKVSRDVIFVEDEFMNVRKPDFNIGKLLMDPAIESDPEIDASDSETVVEKDQESDTAAPAIYEEIVVQALPNRAARRVLTKALGYKASAFLAVTWPRNFAEAMLPVDAEKWEQAMERELASIHANNV